jgi:hypothetical protein
MTSKKREKGHSGRAARNRDLLRRLTAVERDVNRLKSRLDEIEMLGPDLLDSGYDEEFLD